MEECCHVGAVMQDFMSVQLSDDYDYSGPNDPETYVFDSEYTEEELQVLEADCKLSMQYDITL